jgi:hypothetical protein
VFYVILTLLLVTLPFEHGPTGIRFLLPDDVCDEIGDVPQYIMISAYSSHIEHVHMVKLNNFLC